MKHDYLLEIKLALTAAAGALTAWLGTLALPVYILVACNIIDYATGICAAPYRGEKRTSTVGFRGIAKKICMWLLVVVGFFVDQVILYAVSALGIVSPFQFLVAILVAVWLICNELVSILENIADIGVEGPPFLLAMVKWVREQTEDKGQIGGGDHE